MRCGKAQGRGPHLPEFPGIAQRPADCRRKPFRIEHPQCGAGSDGIGGRLQEIEGMRANDSRATAGRGLDQVLPAERNQAAADKGDIGSRVELEQLAHRVDDETLAAIIRRAIFTAHARAEA